MADRSKMYDHKASKKARGDKEEPKKEAKSEKAKSDDEGKPAAKLDETPAGRVEGKDGEGGGEDVNSRHMQEMATLHDGHRTERRDLHGTHKSEHDKMYKRHAKEIADMVAKQAAERQAAPPMAEAGAAPGEGGGGGQEPAEPVAQAA